MVDEILNMSWQCVLADQPHPGLHIKGGDLTPLY